MRTCLLASGCAYLLVLLFYRLASFPNLHGDEAYWGLFGLWFKERGLFTPHGMNAYTGSLFGWIVSWVFRLIEPGALALRLPGAVLNASAALLMGIHLGRRFGWAQGAAWLYLLGTSTLFIWKSRLAWEVYALENLLLAVILVVSQRLIEEKIFSPWSVLIFLAANYVGVLNHFIFLSVPLSLALAVLAHLVFHRDWDWLRFFRLAALSLAMGAVVFCLKPAITEAQWQSHKALLAALALALPLAFAAALEAARPWDDLVRRVIQTGSLGSPRAGRILRGALLAGLALFLLVHFSAMLQIWSNVAVFKRLLSWDPPLLLSAALYLWAAALLGAYFLYAAESLEEKRFSRLSGYEKLLIFWPLVYASLFILVTQRSSIRYYEIPSFLITAALAVIAPRILGPGRRWPLLPLALVALGLQACFWKEMTRPLDRRPIEFRIGWHSEGSYGFLSLEPLYELMTRQGICRAESESTFIEGPLRFYLATHRFPCDPSRNLAARYCLECPSPPFFSWTISRAPVRPR